MDMAIRTEKMVEIPKPQKFEMKLNSRCCNEPLIHMVHKLSETFVCKKCGKSYSGPT
jgi:hypothetical protein